MSYQYQPMYPRARLPARALPPRFMILLFLLLSILAPLPLANAGSQLSVSVDSCSGTGDTFTLLDQVSIVCDGYCSWGSQAYFQGKYTIGEDGVYTQYPALTANAWGMQIYSSANSSDYDTLDLCENVNATSSSGSCPDAGTYSFRVNATLPNPKTFSVFSSSFHMTVVTIFDFGDEDVLCSFSVTSRNYMYGGSSGSSGTTTVSAVFLFLGAAICMKKRRRVVSSSDEDQEHVHGGEIGDANDDAEEPATHFEMMERIQQNGHLFSR